jgi:hypothetical protein
VTKGPLSTQSGLWPQAGSYTPSDRPLQERLALLGQLLELLLLLGDP